MNNKCIKENLSNYSSAVKPNKVSWLSKINMCFNNTYQDIHEPLIKFNGLSMCVIKK